MKEHRVRVRHTGPSVSDGDCTATAGHRNRAPR